MLLFDNMPNQINYVGKASRSCSRNCVDVYKPFLFTTYETAKKGTITIQLE